MADKITREHLVNNLHTFVKENGRVPKLKEFKHAYQIEKHFGSFSNFLAENGYSPNKVSLSAEELAEELHRFVDKNGRIPTKRVHLIKKHYGGYNNFLTENGYEPNKSGFPGKTAEELSEELHHFVDTNGRLPKRREFKNYNQIERQYGSFNRFIAANGYKPNKPVSQASSLFGRRFGRLVVISKSDKIVHTQTAWNCQFDCGNLKNDVPRGLLTSGQTRSCGCLHQESFSNLEKRKDYQVEGAMLTHLTNKLIKSNTSGVRGVFFNNRRQKYVASIVFQGTRHHLGYFDTLDDAAAARNEAEEKYFKPILEKYNPPED